MGLLLARATRKPIFFTIRTAATAPGLGGCARVRVRACVCVRVRVFDAVVVTAV